MGKYAQRHEPISGARCRCRIGTRPAPRFEAARPLGCGAGGGRALGAPSDFTRRAGDRPAARARFGAAVSAFDADGDGKLDLYLTSAVIGPKGVRDVLLLNKGDGRFEDASAAFGLPADRASLGVAAADFDADRRIDLFLTGRRRKSTACAIVDGKRFEDISSQLSRWAPPAVSLMARWLDLDQDGDLDLYVVNYCAAADARRRLAGSAGQPPGTGERRVSQRRPARSRVGRDDPGPSAGGDGVWSARGASRVVDCTYALAGVPALLGRARAAYRHRRARPRQRPRPGPGALGRRNTARWRFSTTGSGGFTSRAIAGASPRKFSGLLPTAS